MTISTRSLCYGIAFAIVCVCLTVAADAQAPATSTSATSATTPAATPADPTAPAVPLMATDLGLPGGMPPSAVSPGMPAAGAYGAMPGMGMQPGAMGGMNGMPQPGMGGLGMRQGPYMANDPEMNAMLAQQLRRLQMQEMQLNSDIAMLGGEASPAARELLTQKTLLQTQIRDLEQRLGVSGTGTAAIPGVVGVNPAMMPADMMARDMAMQRMPGVPGYGMTGMGMMGTDPNRMFLEQKRQEVIMELQRVQHQLSFVDASHPMRSIILAQQEELVAQFESLNKQLGQTQTADVTMMPGPGMSGTATPSAAGSTATSLTDMVPSPVRSNAPISPEIVRMQDATRQLRAMGNADLADDLQRRIEQMQTQSFVEPQLPPGMPMPIPATVSAALPQQAELIELRNTVDSLRNEIVSLRDEIRALQILLQQGYQEPLPPPTPSVLGDLPPDYNTVE